jgi:hypothetical protein
MLPSPKNFALYGLRASSSGFCVNGHSYFAPESVISLGQKFVELNFTFPHYKTGSRIYKSHKLEI